MLNYSVCLTPIVDWNIHISGNDQDELWHLYASSFHALRMQCIEQMNTNKTMLDVFVNENREKIIFPGTEYCIQKKFKIIIKLYSNLIIGQLYHMYFPQLQQGLDYGFFMFDGQNVSKILPK